MSITQRHSVKRDEILACLRATKAHPSAAWISDQLRKRGKPRRQFHQFHHGSFLNKTGG